MEVAPGDKSARAMLAVLWVDLVLHRQITEESFKMLMQNFKPEFTAEVENTDPQGGRTIGYKLQVDPKSQIYTRVAIPALDKSNKHLRLDVTSDTVEFFLKQCNEILMGYLHREFPAGEVKSSFAYQANKLIREQTDESYLSNPDGTG